MTTSTNLQTIRQGHLLMILEMKQFLVCLLFLRTQNIKRKCCFTRLQSQKISFNQSNSRFESGTLFSKCTINLFTLSLYVSLSGKPSYKNNLVKASENLVASGKLKELHFLGGKKNNLKKIFFWENTLSENTLLKNTISANTLLEHTVSESKVSEEENSIKVHFRIKCFQKIHFWEIHFPKTHFHWIDGDSGHFFFTVFFTRASIRPKI